MGQSRLRELRLYFGMDQAEMARWVGTKQSVVSLWESGKRRPPVRELAIRFGVSIDWLEELSSRRWGERVVQLGQNYREQLCSLRPRERQSLAEATTAVRVLHAYQFMRGAAPELISADYFARLIGLNREEFDTLDRDLGPVSEESITRLAEYLGIGSNWFTTGSPSSLEYPYEDEAHRLIHQLLAEGITADDIRQVWQVVRAIR